ELDQANRRVDVLAHRREITLLEYGMVDTRERLEISEGAGLAFHFGTDVPRHAGDRRAHDAETVALIVYLLEDEIEVTAPESGIHILYGPEVLLCAHGGSPVDDGLKRPWQETPCRPALAGTSVRLPMAAKARAGRSRRETARRQPASTHRA